MAFSFPLCSEDVKRAFLLKHIFLCAFCIHIHCQHNWYAENMFLNMKWQSLFDPLMQAKAHGNERVKLNHQKTVTDTHTHTPKDQLVTVYQLVELEDLTF